MEDIKDILWKMVMYLFLVHRRELVR
jgi:hypothetical protein